MVDPTLPTRRITEQCPDCNGHGGWIEGDYYRPCWACGESGRITFTQHFGESGWEGTVEEVAKRNRQTIRNSNLMGCLIFLVVGVSLGLFIYFSGE